MSNSEKLYRSIADLFGEDASSLNEESSPDTIEGWDSMGTIDLISQLEKEFSVSFSLLEVEDLKNIGIIKACLEEKGISFTD